MINISKVNRDRYMRDLEGLFKIYISTISSKEMAASLECISSILVLFDQINPRTILDLGSGFSSVAFRWYFLKNKHQKIDRILSVDTDPTWLRKTKEFCRDAHLPLYDFLTWNEILEMETPFDFIFLDLGYTKDRPGYYKTIFNNFITDSSVVVFDDAHKIPLGISDWMKQFNSKEVNIKDITQDNKRYSRLFYKISKKNPEP